MENIVKNPSQDLLEKLKNCEDEPTCVALRCLVSWFESDFSNGSNGDNVHNILEQNKKGSEWANVVPASFHENTGVSRTYVHKRCMRMLALGPDGAYAYLKVTPDVDVPNGARLVLCIDYSKLKPSTDFSFL